MNKISGVVASSGKAKGTARIVLDQNEFENLKQGEILITNLKPDHVLVLKKSGAIVTDEGGITSHLAKAARELKKPCIVNTGNGTQVFKTGDAIEVDAEKGIITKL